MPARKRAPSVIAPPPFLGFCLTLGASSRSETGGGGGAACAVLMPTSAARPVVAPPLGLPLPRNAPKTEKPLLARDERTLAFQRQPSDHGWRF